MVTSGEEGEPEQTHVVVAFKNISKGRDLTWKVYFHPLGIERLVCICLPVLSLYSPNHVPELVMTS